MSILSAAEAIPSRVSGVAQYLLRCPLRQETRDRLESALSPANLQSERGEGAMVRIVVNECVKMGLCRLEDGVIKLSAITNEHLRRGRFSDAEFRDLLVELLFHPGNNENHDFGRMLAWFLAQDVTTIRTDLDRFRELVTTQVGANYFGRINDVTYEDFCYWSVYLGFARRHKLLAEEAEQIVPDPTDYLERALPVLFPEGKREAVPLHDLMARLAARCPVFEGGSLYTQVQQRLSDRPLGEAHSPISLAWLRLQDRGTVSLTNSSDAAGTVLKDGTERPRYTHAIWNAVRRGGA